MKTAGVNDVFNSLPTRIVPPHLASTAKTVASAVDELVKLRGEIVHSGSVPTSLLKPHAREWRQFVEALATEVDLACRQQCATLLK